MLVLFYSVIIVYICVLMTCSTSVCVRGELMDPWNVCMYVCIYVCMYVSHRADNVPPNFLMFPSCELTVPVHNHRSTQCCLTKQVHNINYI